MSIQRNDIPKLLKLAQLPATEEQQDEIHNQLKQLFDLIDEITTYDVKQVEPLSHPLDMIGTVQLPLREDVADLTDWRSAAQANAPQVESHLYLVPKIIE